MKNLFYVNILIIFFLSGCGLLADGGSRVNTVDPEETPEIPTILLTHKSVEIFGIIHGYGYSKEFIDGHKNGLKYCENNFYDTENPATLNKWKRRTSFLNGYIQSLKKQPEKLAKNLGKLSAIYEYKICNTPNLKNEDCLTYMELSPRSFF